MSIFDRMSQTSIPPGAVDWATLPDLLLFDEVVAITRHAAKTAYTLLGKGKFPIAPLPNVRPYRFPKVNVKAWVEAGTITNEAMRATPRRRRATRASRVAA
jgi:hypothetical protein